MPPRGIELRRLDDGALVRTLDPKPLPFIRERQASFSADGSRVLLASIPTVKVYEVATAKVLVDQTSRHAGASLSPDGKKIAKVLLLDPRPRTPVTASIVFEDVP